MEFGIGDRVAVMTREGEVGYVGTVTGTHDDSASHADEIGCECAYDVEDDELGESHRVHAAYVFPGPAKE